MTDLPAHAQKALDALELCGRLIQRNERGILVWHAARQVPGLGRAWKPEPELGRFMDSSVRELIKRGLAAPDGEDRIRRA